MGSTLRLEGRAEYRSHERAYFDTHSERWFSRAEAAERVAAIAGDLRFPRKALAFCFCRNRVESVISYLACLEAAHAVLLIDPDLAPQFTQSLISLYRPDFLLAPSNEPKILQSIDPEAFTVLDSNGIAIARARHHYEHNLHPDLAVLLSTSGSTGSPKLVRLSLRNIAANAESIAQALAIQPSELAIGSLPLHYSYGLSVINSHLVAGAAVVLTTDAVTSGDFWKTARAVEATSFAGVPYTYQVLARLKLPAANVPSITTMTQAGGKLSNDLATAFHRLMCQRHGRFFVMYGQTEATARICVLPHDSLPEKPGSCGKPIPGGRLRIELDGEPVADPAAPGELIYYGPNVMMGYATSASDLSLGDALGGRLQTGDLGHLDPDGFAFITGRAKRFSKVLGLRLNLDEVEMLLKPYGPTAILGGEDRLLIFCEYSDTVELTACQKDLAAKLGLHPRTLDFRRVEKLPLTSNGKTDYRTLAGAL